MKIRRPTVSLIADDGPNFGRGHLHRMYFLREELESSGDVTTTLISRSQFGPENASIQTDEFLTMVRDHISGARPSLCVFDLKYSAWGTDLATLFAPKSRPALRLGIDTPPPLWPLFDEVLIPSLARPLAQESLIKPFWGPDWILASSSPQWNPSEDQTSGLILTGSQSFEEYYPWLADQMKQLESKGCQVTWIVGKEFEHKLQRTPFDFSGIRFQTDSQLSLKMSEATLAISRFGVTVMELAARGIPTIILPGWTKNEEPDIRILEASGACAVAEDQSEVGSLALSISQDPVRRSEMSAASKALFHRPDPHPAVKLVKKMLGTEERTGTGPRPPLAG